MPRHRVASPWIRFRGRGRRTGNRLSGPLRRLCYSDFPFGLWRPRWRFLVRELLRRRREAISTAPSPGLELCLRGVPRTVHVDYVDALRLLDDLAFGPIRIFRAP